MYIKEKLLRILVEADLYKVGESDEIAGSNETYRIIKSSYGWWDLEIVKKNTVYKTCYMSLPKLARTIFEREKIKL